MSSPMTLLRSEPSGVTFRALLEWVSGRAGIVGVVIQGRPAAGLWADACSIGALSWRRRFPGSESVEPVQILELPLSAHGIDLAMELMGGCLFGPDAGVTASDLFVASEPGSAHGLLESVSSECYASLDVSALEWERASREFPVLSTIIARESSFRFVDDHRIEFLWSDLEEAPDDESRIAVIERMLANSEGNLAEAMAAANLVAEAVAPDRVGDLAWRLSGCHPLGATELDSRGLVERAHEILRHIANDPGGPRYWIHQGGPSEARAEASWLAVALEFEIHRQVGM